MSVHRLRLATCCDPICSVCGLCPVVGRPMSVYAQIEEPMPTVLDASGMAAALERVAVAIAASVPPGCGVGLIGIRSRGDELARRILPMLRSRGVRDIE